MEISMHIGFIKNEIPELSLYLKNNGISCDEINHHCFFNIYETSPHWECICKLLKQGNATCLSETVFSRHELCQAEWLTVRSKWLNGYPQPENGFAYEEITYSCKDHCDDCGTGLYQVDCFRIKKTPNWGKRNFMMLNWVRDELFVNDTAKKTLINSKLVGIEFRNVKNKSGTEILPNVSQLVIPTILPEGIITNRRSIDEICKCPSCGIKKYHPTGIGMHAFQRHIFNDAPDIVKTSEVFGWGHSAPRLIIVSQKMYQIITKNKLDRGLVFEPLELI